jgi:hypothetical protein
MSNHANFVLNSRYFHIDKHRSEHTLTEANKKSTHRQKLLKNLIIDIIGSEM